jgi:hypothetical protein
MYYYRLYTESKPNLHRAFSVVLSDDVFSESTAAGKDSSKQGVLCGASPSGLKRKEEAMTRVADLMTMTFIALKEHHNKYTEQMQLGGRNTTTYLISLCSLLKSAVAILLGYLQIRRFVLTMPI